MTSPSRPNDSESSKDAASSGPSDFLIVGSAPRPSSDAAFAELVSSFLESLTAAASSTSVAGIDRVSVQGSLDGADIARLDIDASGLSLSAVSELSEVDGWQQFGTVREREEAVLREFSVRAHPTTLQGVAVDLDATVSNLRFSWATDEQSRLAVGESADPDWTSDRPQGRIRLEADQQAIVDAVTALAAEQAEQAGVTISKLEVDLTSVSPREADVQVDARIRKGILSASARFVAHAHIDDAMVLRVTDAKLSSANPVVATLLLAIRKRVDEAVQEPIDLNTLLPSMLRLRDVRLQFGTRLTAELVFD